MRTIPRCCHAFWGWYKASAGRLAPWLQLSCSFGAPLDNYVLGFIPAFPCLVPCPGHACTVG